MASAARSSRAAFRLLRAASRSPAVAVLASELRSLAPAAAVALARQVSSGAIPVFSRGFSASSMPEMVSDAFDGLQAPHGGKLVNLMVGSEAEKKSLIAACQGRTIEMSDRNACDVELLCVGGFSPVAGFMDKGAYEKVVSDMRLPTGELFGLPVVMDTDSEALVPGMKVLLTYKGQNIAVMEITDKWVPNKALEAKKCYGTSSLEHPGVQMISQERGKYYLAGPVHGFELPKRVFPCKTPAELRAGLPKNTDVVAFQCRNPIHRAHYELFTRALFANNVGPGAVCLVHPTVGPTQDDDISGLVRYHTYEVLAKEVNNPNIAWAYLPYSMHMAGPREAIQHMIIRKNYGCTHFIIGRDMAGSKSTLSGEDFYGAYEAQEMANAHAAELGVKTVPSLNVVYTEEEGYVTADVAKEKGLTLKKLSGTQFRKMLRAGEDIPEWFAFKSVVSVLREHTK